MDLERGRIKCISGGQDHRGVVAQEDALQSLELDFCAILQELRCLGLLVTSNEQVMLEVAGTSERLLAITNSSATDVVVSECEHYPSRPNVRHHESRAPHSIRLVVCRDASTDTKERLDVRRRGLVDARPARRHHLKAPVGRIRDVEARCSDL